jgi:hypothetical protein
VFEVPYPRNYNFTGRTELLELIHNHLVQNANPVLQAALHYMGWAASEKHKLQLNMLTCIKRILILFAGCVQMIQKHWPAVMVNYLETRI